MANEFIARKGIISLDSIQVTGSITATGGITISGSISSASFATTAATASSADNFFVRQNLTASSALFTGSITAQTLVVQTVTSSITYSSGSNIFGNQLTNVQQFTGSVRVTGSLNVVGNTCVGGTITGPNFYIPAASAGTYGLADLTAAMQTYGGGSPACSILFYTCGVERMRFTSTGIACFSSTVCSPTVSANSGYFSSQICSTGNSNTFGTAGSTGRAVIVQAGSTNQAIQLKNSSGGDGTISATGGATSMNYSFSTYQCSDVFFICNNGFVGVGTISPKSYSALTVNGQIIGINNIGVDAGQSYRLNNYYNSGTVTDRTISNGYAASIGLDNSNGGMTFNVSSTCVAADNNITTPERFRITGTGIACFASTVCSPFIVTNTIEMGGGATSPSLACVGYGMFGYSGVGLGIAAGATGGNQGMGFFTCGNNERMRIITNGNVGIGNVCPGARLQVKASAAAGATDALYIENSSATSLFQVRDDGLTYMRGNVGINTTTPCSQLDVRGTITNSCTAGNRNYTIDTAHAKISIASGGYVDFCSMSGMVLVNNWTNGAVTAFLVGGGSTAVMGTVTGTAGAMFYNSTTAGYRWCETLGSTANYGFQVFRTRDTA